jgi:hypothetical protein
MFFFQVGDVSCHHGICSWMTKTQNWVAKVVYHVYPGDRIRVDEAIHWGVVTKAFFLLEEIVPLKISWFISLSWFYFLVHNHTCTTSSNKGDFFRFLISAIQLKCSSLFVLVRWPLVSPSEVPSHHDECYPNLYGSNIWVNMMWMDVSPITIFGLYTTDVPYFGCAKPSYKWDVLPVLQHGLAKPLVVHPSDKLPESTKKERTLRSKPGWLGFRDHSWPQGSDSPNTHTKIL